VSELAGGVKLDLRDAELLPGLTEIRLNVLMGGVSVIVSPDLDLEVDGWVFLGGIDKLPSTLLRWRPRCGGCGSAPGS
jgi:predicted membrane protein